MRKRLLYFFAFLIFNIWVEGVLFAIPATDSLRKCLLKHHTQDSIRVSLLLRLANEYEMNNPDSVSILGREALSISYKLQYYRGLADAYEILGAGFSGKGNYDSAMRYFRHALAIGKENKLKYIFASKYNHIGNTYFLTGKYTEASMYYDSAIHIAKKHGNPEISGKANSNLANVFYKMGNYTRALDYYLAGLKIQEELGVENNIASDLSNIANVYYRLGNYAQALAYTNRAMELNRRSGIKERIIGTLTTYALIYNDRKMYDSSLQYLDEAMQLANEMQSPFLQNILKGNIAECYLKKGDYDKASVLYGESLTLSGKLGDNEGTAIAKAGLGEIYLRQGNEAKGRVYLTDALGMMQQAGIQEQALDVAAKLSESYERTGDYKNALRYHKIQAAISDSLKKQKAGQEVEQVVFNYEIHKKEDKIKSLKKDRAILDSKNRSQAILLWVSLSGLLSAAVAIWMFYRNNKNVRKSRALIVQQKEEIERQAHKLSELNDLKDATFSVLAHDLRSPVNALASTMMLLDEQVIDANEFVVYKQELNNKLQSVSILLDNMLYWAKSQMKGEHSLHTERLNVKRKILRVIAVLGDAANQKNIRIINNVPENLWMQGDRDHIDIIIRNIVSNAIKFTHEHGRISFSAALKGETVHIHIADDGVGMTEEQIARLFSADTHISTKGTEGEKGTGLGMELCYDLIKRNAGSISVASAPGEGSTFTISLPAAPVAPAMPAENNSRQA